MATIQSFEEIEACQKARELTRVVYACSGAGAFAKDFALRDQIRRAAVSILSGRLKTGMVKPSVEAELC